ncbi:hypothetical protein LX32DRAFT_116022 [Colletotrichum zoysiae]|uniref:Uncharacterized protein n=1 Tax=Colletotrichum zoysiae TaxID=1216348 RepID=A0AAD9M3M1_9PEZI|nr:hypothetical protein LX32DRAFT_116022 [Colletotrichum zoysiae]
MWVPRFLSGRTFWTPASAALGVREPMVAASSFLPVVWSRYVATLSTYLGTEILLTPT